MPQPANSNETYCTFTLASDVTAGGLPSEAEIAKDLESSDDLVSNHFGNDKGFLSIFMVIIVNAILFPRR
jgi:hypothetical protein